MAQPIDLSTLLKNKSQNEDILDFDSLSPEQREALQRAAEQHPEAAADKVTTAFLLVYKDGRWMATPDVSTPLVLAREASTDDIWDGCTKVVRDIDISETAQAVVGFQQQLAMQMAQQRQAQKIAQGLQL